MLNLGLSLIIFLVIGVVVMAMFCLVTRYFNKKLEKALENQNQVYSMIQQIRGTAGNQDDGDQYENYVQKKENQAMNKYNNKNAFQLQMTEVKQPLKGYGAEDTYGMGKLKKRLDGQPSIPLNPETGRSKTSLRSFRPEKLDSMRKSNVSQRKQTQNSEPNQDISQADPNNTKEPKRKDKKRQNFVTHKYINRIVCYIQQGIFIVQNNLLSIEKTENMIQKRSTKKQTVKQNQKSFEDTLEAYGFEKGLFCAFKFQTTLQVPHMKPNQQYPVSSLKKTESKSSIQFAQFYNLRGKLEEIN